MKRFFLSALFLACLVISANLHAQNENDASQNIVIIKTMDDDGTVTIKKKRLDNSVDVQDYVDELDIDNAKNIDITISTTGDERATGGENLFMFKSKGGNCIKINGDGDWEEALIDLDFDFDFDDMGDAHQHMHHGQKTGVLLGIYPENHSQGVGIDGIVRGGGAEKAGLLKDDVLTAINGQTIQTKNDLSVELAKYEPGDVVKVSVLRNGQEMTLSSELTAKEKSYSRSYSYSSSYERDPCKVFYGVYVGSYGHGKEGVGVSGIVGGNDWPAEVAGLQKGDRIIAIDGIPVTNHNELVTERDKHEPGEAFTFTYLRDGEVYDVDARFKACPKDEPVTPEAPVEEITVPDEELEYTDNELDLEEFRAYPNPTFGNLNVQFRGDAIPTTVRVVDSSGKVVYEESLRNFDGYYNKQLDISGGALGTLILSVTQDGKATATPVILVTRA